MVSRFLPFNSAIFLKTVRDSFLSVLATGIGLIVFVILFSWAMLNMGPEILEFAAKFSFLQKILEMSLGIKVDGKMSISIMYAICFTHAMVMMLTWTALIATATRVTVGEVERGTADMLLSMPVTRGEVYFSTSLVWMIAAFVLAFCPVVGIYCGTLIFEIEEEILLSRYVNPAVNFACLNLAIASLSCMLGSILNRRGITVSIAVAIIFTSVVMNFLEPFIEAIKQIRFLSLLTYFRPVESVRSGEWPIGSIAVLLGLAIVSWVIGLIVYVRKDIPTA